MTHQNQDEDGEGVAEEADRANAEVEDALQQWQHAHLSSQIARLVLEVPAMFPEGHIYH